MVGTFTFYSKAINSLTDDDVRISERLYMPYSKLRGFESGKVGPVDSSDYVGGNYASAINVAATLPNFLPDIQNTDFSIFFDALTLWLYPNLSILISELTARYTKQILNMAIKKRVLVFWIWGLNIQYPILI